jgi:hypothetical protein
VRSVAAPEFTRPAFLSVPPRPASGGAEARDLAATSGLVLDPWQAWTLDQILGEQADGTVSAFEAAVVVSRQNGKGAILEALALYWLFLEEVELILWSAHEFKTAAEGFRRMRILLQGAPDLWSLVGRVTTSNGDEAIELTTGQRLKFVARSKASGKGFTGDKIILDEAYDLDADQIAAMVPTLATRPNPQVIYTSSAGMADSDVLRSVRDRGRAGGDPSLCYVEWCAPDGADLDDRAAWRAANPGYGVRIGEKFISNERRLMAATPEKFGRERLGWWDEPVGVDLDRIPLAKWEACADPKSAATGQLVFAVDMPPGGAACSIAVAGRRADGLAHIGVIEYDRGTDWVAARLAELVAAHGGAGIVWQPSAPIGALASKFDDLPMLPVTGTEMAQACGALKDDVLNGRLRHGGTTVLDDAFASAERRVGVEGAWTWGRRKSAGDISPLVAVTLALWGLDADYDIADSVF